VDAHLKIFVFTGKPASMETQQRGVKAMTRREVILRAMVKWTTSTAAAAPRAVLHKLQGAECV